MAKVRLDTLLARRGLFASRARAAASVMAGEVRLGTAGERAAKPGQMVAQDVAVAVDERPRFVSRGGVKLANALLATGVDPAGRRCLDVGASTGGFTDCLLQRGAAHVVAVDVAYGELDWRLRTDPRVTVLERVNARALRCEDLPYRPDLVVADVSFISLTKGRPTGGRRSWPSRRRRASSARPSSASPRRGCRARRATARRSCGSPRETGPARSSTSRPRRPRFRRSERC